ncbi:MAG: endonuclease [Moraxellaceae bacterium]|nr:MAG: endonuclease [Moraxellaceae bacterium]
MKEALEKEATDKTWFVYIILCSDNSYYTGITTDLDRRFEQHQSGKGAKYFYGRQPVEFVYTEVGHDRSSASQREAAIKSLSRRQKMQLLNEKLKV